MKHRKHKLKLWARILKTLVQALGMMMLGYILSQIIVPFFGMFIYFAIH